MERESGSTGLSSQATLTIVDAHADDDGGEDDGAEGAQVVQEAQRVDVRQLAQDQLDDAEVDDELLQRYAAAGPDTSGTQSASQSVNGKFQI